VIPAFLAEKQIPKQRLVFQEEHRYVSLLAKNKTILVRQYEDKNLTHPRVQPETSSESHPEDDVEKVPPTFRACASD
jgi:hypothetical protein